MSLSRFRPPVCATLWVLAWILSSNDTPGATIVAGPGESGFRSAIAAAQAGDTVTLTNQLQLQGSVAIDKQIIITVDSLEAWRIWIEAQFDGAMLDLLAD